jgi:hypothetical protein
MSDSNPSSVSSIIARARARSLSSAQLSSNADNNNNNAAAKQSKLDKWDMKLAQYRKRAKHHNKITSINLALIVTAKIFSWLTTACCILMYVLICDFLLFLHAL